MIFRHMFDMTHNVVMLLTRLNGIVTTGVYTNYIIWCFKRINKLKR
jgi:hypothetical protein